MATAQEELGVLIACADRNEAGLICRAFKRLSSVARLTTVPDGDEVVTYLEGKGKYADRAACPLPRLLIVDEWLPRLSGIEILRWVRSDPRWKELPVVILREASPPAQPELVERLKAAYCTKALKFQGLVAALEVAVCTALRLAWPSALTSGATVFVPQTPPSVDLKIRLECSQ